MNVIFGAIVCAAELDPKRLYAFLPFDISYEPRNGRHAVLSAQSAAYLLTCYHDNCHT